MREAHAHIAAYGQALAMPSLVECGSVEECLDMVRRLAATSSNTFLRLHSARIQGWTIARWPTRAELDSAAVDSRGNPLPCVILSFDHHAAVANSAAMTRATLSAGQRIPPNGEVCIDSATGLPSGLLLEQAAFRAWEAAPEPSAFERGSIVESALQSLASLGFEEVHDLCSQPWLGGELARLERAGRLPIRRVLLYPLMGHLVDTHAARGTWESARVRLAGGKLFADGTLNSLTALLLRPYREPLAESPHGRFMVGDRELHDGIRLTESLGLHIAVHAIGDGAVRRVLDAFDAAATPRPAGNRHRIEHAELIDQADIHRFARTAGGVVCSVQPCHLLADIDILMRQVPDRLDRVLPLKELIETGCSPTSGLLWFGSDVPIVRPDPEDSLYAATERRRPTQSQADAIGWQHRITPAQAAAAFTTA